MKRLKSNDWDLRECKHCLRNIEEILFLANIVLRLKKCEIENYCTFFPAANCQHIGVDKKKKIGHYLYSDIILNFIGKFIPMGFLEKLRKSLKSHNPLLF